MPAALPIVAAFASGAVGAVVAGTAGLAAYATVAGAVLTGVGALTGKKDLVKIGSVLSLGGGLATAFGVGGSAASAATGGMGAQAIEKAAEATAPSLTDAASSVAGSAAGEAATAAPAIAPMSAEGVTSAGVVQDAATGVTNGATAAPPPTTLAGIAAQQQAPGAGGGVASTFATGGTTAAPTINPQYPTLDETSRIGQIAQGTTSNDLQSWWQKAQAAGKGVAGFMEKNPNLLKLGGDVLNSMYGAQAQQFDWQKSLYERSRANLNSPVALTYTPGGKP